jgi:hypothetical protein
LGHEVDHSPPSSAKVKNEWSHTTTHLICLNGMDRDNFTLLLHNTFNILYSLMFTANIPTMHSSKKQDA